MKNDSSVVEFKELDIWLDKYLQINPKIDSNIINNLHKMNRNLYDYLVNLMNSCTNNENNNIINDYAKKVEIESMRIFGTLNQIKEYRCKDS